ncbi:hypothetical protein BKP45_01685 [Anaerobacillus alkalidiazotrophicus]|uniref:Putative amidase domain-containing protein n=1 Tax=Anaerobacillus alkalidiazotrophicus TaxID=472963 RepID=A0A1S2MCV7_9BACI|nr:amidase domain-containing protein [Anaerobacillus alkalidiazotrophicus]OIJ21505.1 hypothetical protein BKP45_01685 [Anaerobacillus alkalidiazotrophicus]
MSWLNELKEHIKLLNSSYTMNVARNGYIREDEQQSFQRKQDGLEDRGAKIVKSIVDGRVISAQKIDGLRQVDYIVHYQHLIKQKSKFYMEERQEERRAIFSAEELIDDYCRLNEKLLLNNELPPTQERDGLEEEYRYAYSRLEAVRYAERWWNGYNPNYKKFENNCTNFVSQCIHAGGTPMTGHPNRSKGWWYRNKNWSFSWAVAHSLRWHLSGSKVGLRAKEVSKPEELLKGDVICYDFSGDGRWQHTTIVVAKDENNMPLVNAQTTNSRMRYWAYEDSTAWTPNIKYKFFHIIE